MFVHLDEETVVKGNVFQATNNRHPYCSAV